MVCHSSAIQLPPLLAYIPHAWIVRHNRADGKGQDPARRWVGWQADLGAGVDAALTSDASPGVWDLTMKEERSGDRGIGRIHYRSVGDAVVSPTFMIFAPTASSTRACRTRKRLMPY